MKTIPLTVSLLILAVSVCHVQAGIRCGNDIISVGDTTFEVEMRLAKCGVVLGKEVVKTEIEKKEDKEGDEKVKEEKPTERWYIRVKERGGMYCYPLTFEAGILQNIGNWSKCD